MKNTIVAILFVCLVGAGLFPGCSRKPDPEVIAAYKAFADLLIVQDYVNALAHTTGAATAMIEPKTKKEMFGKMIYLKPGGFGTVEASTVDVVASKEKGSRLLLDIVYRASISWEGSTANPMSPGSWKTFNQKATLEKVGNAWKISQFAGEGFDGV
ncbi:MAG: hypothetical protein GY697_07265 [Desulfobacterales bacterium]|nr:hypothetical protein [Desulfobacterales bacterium]